MAVMGVVGVIIYEVYIAAGTFTKSEQQRIDVDLSASRILTVMDRNLRQAKGVVANHTIGITPYQSGESVLIVAFPSVLVGGLSPDKLDYGVFLLQGSNLSFILDPDASSQRTAGTTTITGNVRDIYFRYNAVAITASTGVTMTLAAEETVLGKPYTQYAVLNETFRNHNP